jgi:branched-chain amino acid transport system substrate-binding protein
MATSDKRAMNRRRFLEGAGVTGLVGLGAGFGVGRATAGGTDTASSGGAGGIGKIRIGAALPLTGNAAADGQEMKRGLEIAVAEARAKKLAGGDIDTVVMDTKDMGPQTLVTVFNRLIQQEKVDAIIIGYATGTGPELDIVAEAGIPYMHVSTSEVAVKPVRENPEKYWMVFQADPTEVWYGRDIPRFMQQLIKEKTWSPANKRAAVVTSNNPYSVSIAKLFSQGVKNMGWDVPVFEQVVTPVSSWNAVIGKIKKAQPAFIVNTNYTPSDLATFTKEIVKDPPPALLFEQYGPSIPEFIKLAGDAANGVLWSTVVGILPDKIGNDYRARYQKRFGEAPGFSNAGTEYDMVNIYLNAVGLAGSPKERRLVAQNIQNSSYRGVCGTYRFTTSDHTVPPYPSVVDDPSVGMPTLYFQIQDGKQVPVAPAPYTQGKVQLPPWL